MKYHLYYIGVLIFFMSPYTWGQPKSSIYKRCISQSHVDTLSEREEKILKLFEQLLTHSSLRSDEIFHIPTVVHVFLHPSDPPIDTQLIFRLIDRVNHHLIVPPSQIKENHFLPRVGVPSIRLCLETSALGANREHGVIFYHTDEENLLDQVVEGKYKSIFYTNLGGRDPILSDRVLNIYVAQSELIDGYATIPQFATNKNEDGILLDIEQLNSVTESNILTHEVGHYFGLLHLWGEGQGCEYDDGIEDTPLQYGPHFSCKHNETQCSDIEMITNFMDYSGSKCTEFFTQQQSQAMRNTILTERQGLIQNALCNKKAQQKPIDFYYYDRAIYITSNYLYQFQAKITVYNQLGQILFTSTIEDQFQTILPVQHIDTQILFAHIETGSFTSIIKFFHAP